MGNGDWGLGMRKQRKQRCRGSRGAWENSHYSLLMPNAQCPMPHAPCPITN
ncbi:MULTISPECIES: hypothetical protein [unclassified Tolypothrix]|uniref:hypothetical protein n=1 Tax=unclassified Tolypothrix TaxID=2649714 RepID=UPI0012D7B779|nr:MULTISPECIES: hypothetical protein [unclassified Tolypothrix]UYD32561.1 hypothetical protein HG267_26600 [Tolypothrix sp. PCC 7601]